MRTSTNQRKAIRVNLRVPVTIKIREGDGKETLYQGQVIDASKYGLKIKTSKFFQKETVILLTLAFPYRFREYDFFSDRYHTYAAVVHTKRFGTNDFEMGVRLLHNQVPSGFEPFSLADV
jgi:hypothetical protein